MTRIVGICPLCTPQGSIRGDRCERVPHSRPASQPSTKARPGGHCYFGGTTPLWPARRQVTRLYGSAPWPASVSDVQWGEAVHAIVARHPGLIVGARVRYVLSRRRAADSGSLNRCRRYMPTPDGHVMYCLRHARSSTRKEEYEPDHLYRRLGRYRHCHLEFLRSALKRIPSSAQPVGIGQVRNRSARPDHSRQSCALAHMKALDGNQAFLSNLARQVLSRIGRVWRHPQSVESSLVALPFVEEGKSPPKRFVVRSRA